VYLPIEELLRQLYPEEKELLADHIQIKLNPDVELDSAVAVIRGVWEGFASKELDWEPYLIRQVDIATAKQMQSRYIAELRKQILLIFGVISASVVILIFCIFYMIVRIKQKDIAIMKSCGASGTTVAWIFVGFGICVGIFGSVFGAVIGYIITKNINVIERWIRIIFGLKLWKSSVYIFSKIPNEVDWNIALCIMLFATIAAALGALLPAIVAAKTKPVEILRYE
jgi:lipoprotein-releasing system permease protein